MPPDPSLWAPPGGWPSELPPQAADPGDTTAGAAPASDDPANDDGQSSIVDFALPELAAANDPEGGEGDASAGGWMLQPENADLLAMIDIVDAILAHFDEVSPESADAPVAPGSEFDITG